MLFSLGILLGVILLTIYLSLMYFSEALVLLVFAEAILFVVSIGWFVLVRRMVRVRIEVPISISETEKENTVKLYVINSLPVPIHRMKALVVVEDTISGYRCETWMKLPSVYGGENVYTHAVAFPAAGNYEISVKRLRVYDMTGLLYCNMRSMCHDRVQIMPHMYDMSIRVTSAVRNFYGEADSYDEHTAGQDRSEIFQVREYKPGDRIQHVHWKLTAKEDELMVKEHSLPKSCPVVLCLKFDPSDRKMRMQNGLSFMEAVTSLSYSMMDAGCAHYIVWYKADTRDIVRVRVDDEESLFYFIGIFMKVKWEKTDEDIVDRYKEKYPGETYVYMLSLDETLTLYKDGSVHTVLDGARLKESVEGTELIL